MIVTEIARKKRNVNNIKQQWLDMFFLSFLLAFRQITKNKHENFHEMNVWVMMKKEEEKSF